MWSRYSRAIPRKVTMRIVRRHTNCRFFLNVVANMVGENYGIRDSY
jgi:hypothetical protein